MARVGIVMKRRRELYNNIDSSYKLCKLSTSLSTVGIVCLWNLIQNNVCKPNFKSSNGYNFWILSINYFLFINLMNDLQYKSINDPFAQLKDRDILFLYILMSPLTTADRDKYHSIRELIVARQVSLVRRKNLINLKSSVVVILGNIDNISQNNTVTMTDS